MQVKNQDQGEVLSTEVHFKEQTAFISDFKMSFDKKSGVYTTHLATVSMDRIRNEGVAHDAFNVQQDLMGRFGDVAKRQDGAVHYEAPLKPLALFNYLQEHGFLERMLMKSQTEKLAAAIQNFEGRVEPFEQAMHNG